MWGQQEYGKPDGLSSFAHRSLEALCCIELFCIALHCNLITCASYIVYVACESCSLQQVVSNPAFCRRVIRAQQQKGRASLETCGVPTASVTGRPFTMCGQLPRSSKQLVILWSNIPSSQMMATNCAWSGCLAQVLPWMHVTPMECYNCLHAAAVSQSSRSLLFFL